MVQTVLMVEKFYSKSQEGYIQWQYTGDLEWTNLVDINTLTGVQGVVLQAHQ